MVQDAQRELLEVTDNTDIQIYGIKGTRQFVVPTPHTEYYFTRLEDARSFANKLMARRRVNLFRNQKLAKNPSISVASVFRDDLT